jgi:hypothetical protein
MKRKISIFQLIKIFASCSLIYIIHIIIYSLEILNHIYNICTSRKNTYVLSPFMHSAYFNLKKNKYIRVSVNIACFKVLVLSYSDRLQLKLQKYTYFIIFYTIHVHF